MPARRPQVDDPWRDDELPLGSLLFRVAALRQARFVEQAGLAPTAYRLLQLLERTDGMSQSALEAVFEADAAVITRHAKQLERDGLVLRRPDERDRRFTRVYLTQAGRARSTAVATAIDAMDADVWSGISPDDLAVMTAALRRARANLRRPRPGG